MDRDIREYTRSCPLCQKYKGVKNKVVSRTQPKIVRGPNRMVSVDIAGPYGPENGYVLTVVDVWSGYAQVERLEGLRTSGVLKVLRDRWICKHGPPLVMLTDRGSQFESGELERWCRKWRIARRRTTAYHPQTNTNAERVHRWLKEQLAMLVSKYGGEWHEYLAEVIYGHNVSEIAGVGVSPWELWYGRGVHLPIDGSLELGSGKSDRRSTEEMDEVYKRMTEKREAEINKLLEKESKASRTPLMEKGTWVMVKTIPKGKLGAPWSGPYRVVERLSPTLYKVRRKKWGVYKEDVINVGRLREFNPREEIMDVSEVGEGIPTGLELAKSSIPEAGWGVFTTRLTGAGRVLGVYEGEPIGRLEYKRRYPHGEAEYAVPFMMGDQEGYVDASDPRTSGWARYINYPGPGETSNVDVQYEGTQVYVVTLRELLVGEELLWEANEPPAGVLGGKRASGNSKLRGLLMPRHAREEKRWEGRHELPARLQVRQQTEVLAEPLIPAESEPEELPRGDWDEARAKVGEFVLVHDSSGYKNCMLGEVMEVSEEEEGKLLLWVYGLWTAHPKDKGYWEYGWKRGWVSKNTDKVLFSTPRKAAQYKRYVRWVSVGDVVGRFTPLSGRGGLCVPEKEAREALMKVRDREREMDGTDE